MAYISPVVFLKKDKKIHDISSRNTVFTSKISIFSSNLLLNCTKPEILLTKVLDIVIYTVINDLLSLRSSLDLINDRFFVFK